jgi:glutathione synthase/RimK-type ligase-like ATP-grasp enzyme
VILLVCEPGDPHGMAIAQELTRRDKPIAWFDHSAFPADTEVSLWASKGEGVHRSLRSGRDIVDLDSITAVWLWLPAQPVPHQAIRGAAERRFIRCACEYFLWDLWQTVGCMWVPGSWSTLMRAENKMSQLQLARDIGFDIPRTLVSNSPAHFAEFYRECNGEVISKIVHSRAWRSIAEYEPLGFTQVVSKRDSGYAHTIRYCPTIFQAYVPKLLELRITIVGAQVFAIEIHSQQSKRSRDDWRRDDLRKTPHRVHTLPQDIERLCLAIVEALGVTFGAIDMIVTPDGRYVFLEINTLGGAWLWVEELTQMPITTAICDLLVEAKAGPGLPGIVNRDRNGR